MNLRGASRGSPASPWDGGWRRRCEFSVGIQHEKANNKSGFIQQLGGFFQYGNIMSIDYFARSQPVIYQQLAIQSPKYGNFYRHRIGIWTLLDGSTNKVCGYPIQYRYSESRESRQRTDQIRTNSMSLLPSGKPLHSYGNTPFFMGKSTINGHFQQQTVSLPEGSWENPQDRPLVPLLLSGCALRLWVTAWGVVARCSRAWQLKLPSPIYIYLHTYIHT